MDPARSRLGLHPDDARDLAALTARVAADPAAQARVDALAAALRERIGRVGDRTPPPCPVPDAAGVVGAVPLLALVATADDVAAEYARRGVGPALAWDSLDDIGRQVAVHRRVHGEFGLGAWDWVLPNHTGGMLRPGRLQFLLEGCPWRAGAHVVSVHIPEGGPLDPGSVDAALDRARDLAPRVWPEADIAAFTCTSWLLDPGWADVLPAGGNIRAFAQRFTPFGTPRDGRRDAIYFAFHVETPPGGTVDAGSLTARTSLQRAVLTRLRRGDRLLTCPGRMPFSPPA